MEAFFRQTRELLHRMTEVSCYFRYQRDAEAYETAEKVISMLQIYVEDLEKSGFKDEAEGLYPILQRISEAVKMQDRIQILALLQKELAPVLYELQGTVFGQSDGILKDYWGKNRLLLHKKDRNLYRSILSARDDISDDYQLSWARTGDLVLTVKTERGTVRLNSSGDPWQEALLFAMGELGKEYEECVIFGYGLGYHVEALVKESHVKKIVVLEYDLTQLAIALSYRDLSGALSNNRVSVLYCPKPDMYIDWLKTKEGRLSSLWYPSIKTVRERAFREVLENYWIENSSIKYLGDTLEKNFKNNMEKNDKEVSVLKEIFYKKTMLLVAAGPSLEENIEELKTLDRSEHVLVCVGTVAIKLIGHGIYPDFLIMIDGQADRICQIRGIEDCMVPLIYTSTVAANVVTAYQGKRYIAFQKGFPAAEQYAAKRGYSLYHTGDSVATFAIDMGIQMGCSCIICIGLDLGYLDKRSHAFGVGHSVVDNKNLRKVEGIVSNYVYTNRAMDICRQWIEKRIRGEKNTKFINVSKGARIHGMEEKKLKDCF